MELVPFYSLSEEIIAKIALNTNVDLIKKVYFDKDCNLYIFVCDDFYLLADIDGANQVIIRIVNGKIKDVEGELISFYDLLDEEALVCSFDGKMKCALAMTIDNRSLTMAVMDKYLDNNSVLSIMAKHSVISNNNGFPYIYYQAFNYPDFVYFCNEGGKSSIYYLVEFNFHNIVKYIYGIWKTSNSLKEFYERVKDAYDKDFPTYRLYVNSKLASNKYFSVKSNLLLGRLYKREELDELFEEFGGLNVNRSLIKFYNGELDEINVYNEILKLIRNRD